jgi:hypothetical protein
MTGPTASVQPRRGIPLVIDVLDVAVGLGLECFLVIVVDALEKLHGGLVLANRLVVLLTSTCRLLLIVSVNDPANLEPSSTVTPMAHLLGLHPVSPRDRLTCMPGSLSNVSSLLPIIDPLVLYAAMFLNPAYLSYNIRACIATQPALLRWLDVWDRRYGWRWRLPTLQLMLITGYTWDGGHFLPDALHLVAR